eukprot:c39272_g1_i1.p1 GENE.c39272_g1_i1~~c39272_g1_i1.p1  ORF type:complete len:406 (-),score=73.31 c39272_g1_i1:197-1378(-)
MSLQQAAAALLIEATSLNVESDPRLTSLCLALTEFLQPQEIPTPTTGTVSVNLVNATNTLFEKCSFAFEINLNVRAEDQQENKTYFAFLDLIDSEGRKRPELFDLPSDPREITPNVPLPISNAKITKVSSKHGGPFQLAVRINESPNPTAPYILRNTTNKFDVKSARLKGRIPVQNLTPECDIVMLPHIGPQFAPRLKELLNITQIRDLAEYAATQTNAKFITGKICKLRSSLTPDVMLEVLQLAHSVAGSGDKMVCPPSPSISSTTSSRPMPLSSPLPASIPLPGALCGIRRGWDELDGEIRNPQPKRQRSAVPNPTPDQTQWFSLMPPPQLLSAVFPQPVFDPPQRFEQVQTDLSDLSDPYGFLSSSTPFPIGSDCQMNDVIQLKDIINLD